MKRLFWVSTLSVACLAALPMSAPAGPNAGAVLGVQGNVLGVDTAGEPWTAIAIPENCADQVPQAMEDPQGIEWYILVVYQDPGASDPGFNTLIFGVGDYNEADCYIALTGPVDIGSPDPLEVSSANWPNHLSGTAVSWSPNCLDGHVEPIYYLGVYAYAPAVIPLGDYYPNQSSAITSCGQGGGVEEDLFAAYTSIFCGGAPFQPDDIVCPGTTAVEETTWGKIKTIYR